MDVYSLIKEQRFVWDAEKAASNLVKHGITFGVAALVFFDYLYLLQDASVEGEQRDAAVGIAGDLKLLYVVHIQRRDGLIRIISARAATAQERRLYENRRRKI